MRRFTVLIIVFGVSAMVARAGGDETKLEARMSAGANAEAKGKYEAKDSRTRLSVEVQGTANAVPGGAVRIVIGSFSATVPFDAVANNFDLNLDSQDGDAVPTVSAGDMVQVFDARTGGLMLSGPFVDK